MELVTFTCAPSTTGAALTGEIHINPKHVTAIKWLDNAKATAVFVSNFQILVDEAEESVIKRLGINLTQNQGE